MSDASRSNDDTFTIDRLNGVVDDVKTLLDYLGRLDDGRLQAHFNDTRPAVAEGLKLRASPPCRTYAKFLARLTRIGIALRGGHIPPAEEDTDPAANPPGSDQPLENIPFLVWSRDFLAAVAQPATVETIEVTTSYVQAKALQVGFRALSRKRRPTPDGGHGGRRPPAGNHPPAPPDRDRRYEAYERNGRSLAWSTWWLEMFSYAAIAVVILVSTYVLAGQSLLDQKQSQIADYTGLNQSIEAILENSQSTAAATIISTQSGQQLTFGCPATPITPAAVTPAAITTADLVPFWSIASTKPIVDETTQTYQNRMLVRLSYYCEQLRHANTVLDATSASLQSWTHVTTGLYLGHLFGDAGSTLKASNADLLERSGETTKAILQAIALNLMPCIYGFIGAAAATLRLLRRKLDSSTMSYTDRGRVRQNALLGVMSGAIMGLFTGYIMSASAVQGLGLSALAFLAGYNVAGVFAFFDELSARIFRPSDVAPTKA
jgi:hypothetical protein